MGLSGCTQWKIFELRDWTDSKQAPGSFQGLVEAEKVSICSHIWCVWDVSQNPNGPKGPAIPLFCARRRRQWIVCGLVWQHCISKWVTKSPINGLQNVWASLSQSGGDTAGGMLHGQHCWFLAHWKGCMGPHTAAFLATGFLQYAHPQILHKLHGGYWEHWPQLLAKQIWFDGKDVNFESGKVLGMRYSVEDDDSLMFSGRFKSIHE